MDETVKRELDLRLAKGEILIDEYNSIIKHINGSDKPNVTSDKVKSPANTGLTSKQKALLGLYDNISPSTHNPYEVTKELFLFESQLSYKGTFYNYNSIMSLKFTSSKSTINFISSSKSLLEIIFDNNEKISVRSASMIIEGKKFHSITTAYIFLSKLTFELRLEKIFNRLDRNGFIDRDGVRIFKNSTIQQGNTLINLKTAKNNNCIQFGSTIDCRPSFLSGWYIYQPNKIIIGETGTKFYSKRINFDSVTDKDIIHNLISQLAQ